MVSELAKCSAETLFVAAISFCVDANREARKTQPLGLSACCLALLSECACSVCARLRDFFALMYVIIDTIGELDSIARLNGVCIGLTSAKHALSAFYASRPLMADHLEWEICGWLTCLL
jgi:hypothetical protein